jgi:phage terminase Nu1 subunit (DNA packaging protein)
MATQQEIADDLGLSQIAISNALNALGLFKREWEALSVEEARKILIRHYTEVAAGRGGDEQYKLTKERARESRLKGDMLDLQIQEKAATLIPADAVEREWLSLIVGARSELLLLPGKIAHEIKSLYGVTIDPALIENYIIDALRRLAAKSHESLADEEAAA